MVDGRQKKLECKRCGRCCLTNMLAYATKNDIERWEAESRQDILDTVTKKALWAGDMIVSPDNGRDLGGCSFLEVESGVHSCLIYESRPDVCRNFEPGSSRLCPQWACKKEAIQ